MKPPGGLLELGADGSAAWQAAVAAVREQLVGTGKWSEQVTDDLALIPEVRAPDWPAFPARIAACLGRERALSLLDWRPDGEGDVGRCRHQEEYLEWRIVRDDGKIRRVEMTTELREYWELLAAHEPQRTLEIVAEFAGEQEVPPEAVYGATDPFDAAVTPNDRASAFSRTMLPSPDPEDRRDALRAVSPYNDGTRAICCLIHPFNTLLDLLRLVATSAHPFLVRDPVTDRTRFPSGSEAIVGVKAVAQDGRNSDPLVVERVVRFATENRRIGFDDPAGIYIRSFQHHELSLPDGGDIPEHWFHPEGPQTAITMARGSGPHETDDGRPRYQRLTIELPHDCGLLLGDLVVRRTGEPVRFGGQLAALTQLGVYLRTGPASGIASVDPQDPRRGDLDCESVVSSWEEARNTGGLP